VILTLSLRECSLNVVEDSDPLQIGFWHYYYHFCYYYYDSYRGADAWILSKEEWKQCLEAQQTQPNKSSHDVGAEGITDGSE
jgi:hypothetical protein